MRISSTQLNSRYLRGIFRPTQFLTAFLAVFLSTALSAQSCPPVEPLIAPYTQNFDASTTSSSGYTPFADCWTMAPVTSGSTLGWRVDANGTPSSSTGPSADNTTGSGNYVFLETSGGSGTAEVETPFINIDLLDPAVRQLSFYYHMYGATMGTLTVEVFDGTAYTSV